MKIAKGTQIPSGKRQVAITFEQELFDRIAAEAVKQRRSFTQQVHVYIEKGMKR